MLGCPPGIIHPAKPCSSFSMGEAVMPSCMTEEAYCQEDRGINAETRYVFHFSRFIFALIVFARFFIGYFTLSLPVYLLYEPALQIIEILYF
jgi:hypothetical protein